MINSPVIGYTAQDIRSAASIKHFVRRFFRDPMDEVLPFTPEKWQDAFFDAISFGDKSIVGKTPRGFGKTVAMASAGAALCEMGKYWVGFFSMSQDQSDEAMRYADYFHKTSQYPYKPLYKEKDTETEKRFDNGSRLFSFPMSAARVHGKRLHYAFVDEMSRIEDEFLRVSIRPTLRRIGLMFIGMSTPFGMSGEFWRCVNDHQNYHIIDIGPLDVSFVTKESILREFRDYGVYLDPSLVQLPDDEFLAAINEIEDFAVAQEILGRFINPGDRVFPHPLISRSYRTDWKLIEEGADKVRYAMSADFGKSNDRSVFMIGHQFNNAYWLDYMESWLESEIPKGKEFYPFMRSRIAHLCKKFNVKDFIPDGSGVGGPVLDECASMFKQMRGAPKMYMHKGRTKGYIFNEQTKVDLVDNLIEQFQQDNMRIPWHNNTGEVKCLENELLSFTYEISNTRIKKIRYGVQNAHDDRVITLALLAWGLSQSRPWMFAKVVGA